MLPKLTARNLLLIAMLLLVTGLLVPILGRQREPVSKKSGDTLPPDVDLALKTINYTETRDGRRHWSLKADSAEFDSTRQASTIKNVHMVFFDRQGEEQVVLTADQGSWATASGEVSASGNVVIKAGGEYSLFTDQLQYSEERGQITSEHPVRMVGRGVEMTGRGLVFSVQSRTLQLQSAVKATITSRQDG
jgi:LPS export ABC transporter protein LptC